MHEELAQRLLAANPDGLWLLGLDGSTLYVNDRMCALVGRSVDELTSETIFDQHDDQGRQDLAEHLAEMNAHHPGRDNDEVLLIRPDGTQVWVLASWSPVLDEHGELMGYLHRLTEYTERRELVERLSQREAELESAQRIARLGSWTWDVLRDQITWSPELYRIYGVAPDNFTASYEGFLSRAHPDDREAVATSVEAVMSDGTGYEYESRIITEQGEIRWVKARGVVDRDEHGAPIRLHGTCQDITDLRTVSNAATAATRRLHLLREMAEASNRSDSLAEALASAGKALDPVSEWNALAVWARGYTDASPWRLAHDLSQPGSRLQPSTQDAEESWNTARIVVAAAGESRTFRVSLPIQVQGNVVCVAQLACGDGEPDPSALDLFEQVAGQLGRVAERELAAVELADARDDAMAASAHKSAFLATMSHEIRTPMNGVIGLTDLLLRTGLDQHQRRLADGLRGAGLTLLALINDILDLSKIESGAVELERAPFQLSDVLDQTATIITAPAQEKRLELVMSCDPAVPHTLLGDRVRLGQVLTNLASNAVKFTDQGEVVVELTLEEDAEPDRILLRAEVRDTGIGTGADAESLFEAFTQADRSTTRSHGGTGLGLTISRRLVHDMGGTIGTEQRAGGGSIFWFVVPLDRADADAPSPLAPLERRRVLVVDDNTEASRALARQLEAWGLDAQVAGSAAQALPLLLAASASPHPFELALIDLDMPDGGGLTLGRFISAHHELAALATILLSDDPSTRAEDATDAGFRCTIDKPLRLTELHDAIVSTTLDTGEMKLPRASALGGGLQEPLGLTVLIVEDNPVNQLVAQGLLEGLGCVSSVAANGEEAVKALAPGHVFDLVLMDCRMPRMDGYEATERIREREQGTRIPIIAMTASALRGERDRCLQVGMDDFITKPVDAATLTRVVTRWSSANGEPLRDQTPVAEHRAPAPELPPILDPERVAMLSELVRDGVNFFERTRSSFLSRIDATLTSMRTARDEENLDGVTAIAHQLKGSALNLGLGRAGAAADHVETLASSDDLSATIAAIDALETAVTEGVQALVAVSAADYTS